MASKAEYQTLVARPDFAKRVVTDYGEAWNEAVGGDVRLDPQGVSGLAYGVILVFLFLYLFVAASMGVAFVVKDWHAADAFVYALPVWLPAVVIVTRLALDGSSVSVVVVRPEMPAEIRYIRLSTGLNRVPIEDLVFFLRRVDTTGLVGKNSIRGVRFPSGARGGDTYHDDLVQALVDADLWEASGGRGQAGGPKLPVDEAIALLTGEGPPTPARVSVSKSAPVDR